jgi:hypothetical protein
VEGAIRKEHTGEEASTSGEEGGGSLDEDERPPLTSHPPTKFGVRTRQLGLPGSPRWPAKPTSPLVKATSKLGKKVDQIEGRCASEKRTSEAVSLMLGVNRPSAFFRLTESNPALDRPMRRQAINVAVRTCVLVFERALQPAGVR